MAEQIVLKDTTPGRSSFLLISLILCVLGAIFLYEFLTQYNGSLEIERQNEIQKATVLKHAKTWAGIPDSIILVRHTKGIDTVKYIPPSEVYILAGDSIFYFPKIYTEYGLPYQLYSIRYIPTDSSGHYPILELASDDKEYIELDDSIQLPGSQLPFLYVELGLAGVFLFFGIDKLYRLCRDFWYRSHLLRNIRKQVQMLVPADEMMQSTIRKKQQELVGWHRLAFIIGMISLTVFYWVPLNYVLFIKVLKGESVSSNTLFEECNPYMFWGIWIFVFLYFFFSFQIRNSSYTRDLAAKLVMETEGTILKVEYVKDSDDYCLTIRSCGIVFSRVCLPTSRFTALKKGDRVDVFFYPRTLEMVDCYENRRQESGDRDQ